MARLRERQAAATRASAGVGSPDRPADVSPDTWKEFLAYLERERATLPRYISAVEGEVKERKRLISLLKAVRNPNESQLGDIASYTSMNERDEQRIADLRAGRHVPGFHGPNLDIERVRLNQIGFLGAGPGMRLAYGGDEKDGILTIQWERWGERTQKMDRITTHRYRIYIGGKPTDVTAETHSIDPDDRNAIDVTDTVMVASVSLTVHDSTFLKEVYPGPSDGLGRGVDLQIGHAYQVTKVEPGRVELTLIDIGQLKEEWLAARAPATRPATSDGK